MLGNGGSAPKSYDGGGNDSAGDPVDGFLIREANEGENLPLE